MNIIFLLVPKKNVEYVVETNTVRQVLEKMDFHHYSAIPLLDKTGKYIGTISDGDLLWHIKNHKLDIEECQNTSIIDIKMSRTYLPIHIDKQVDDLFELIVNQNFVPVLDDRDSFIGIITRKSVMNFMIDKMRIEGK